MKLLLAAFVACLPGVAFAASVSVDVSAMDHSYSGGAGSGLNTGISLKEGDAFQVSAGSSDVWTLGTSSASEPTRTGNADGLTGFAAYSVPNVLTALYGTLVGQIGSGNFFVLGTDFNGTASDTGLLSLFAWDENFEDNSEFITVRITINDDGNHAVVPLPASLPLMLGALGVIGLARRRTSLKD